MGACARPRPLDWWLGLCPGPCQAPSCALVAEATLFYINVNFPPSRRLLGALGVALSVQFSTLCVSSPSQPSASAGLAEVGQLREEFSCPDADRHPEPPGASPSSAIFLGGRWGGRGERTPLRALPPSHPFRALSAPSDPKWGHSWGPGAP